MSAPGPTRTRRPFKSSISMRLSAARLAVVAIAARLAALRWRRENRQERRRGARLRFSLRRLPPAKQKVRRDPMPAGNRRNIHARPQASAMIACFSSSLQRRRVSATTDNGGQNYLQI